MKNNSFNGGVNPEDLSVDLKMQYIEQSASLEDLKRLNTGYLPPVPLIKPDNYYFISYSHVDYKLVYRDIFALQSRGVNVWYDRGMRAGADWKEVAEEYIAPSKCAGVIFYISENSLKSGAIHTEIELAKKYGKSCLTVNLPVSNDYIYEGKSTAGEEVSAHKLLKILKANGEAISDEKLDYFAEVFNDDVIFVKYSDGADEKTEKILSLKKPPLFNLSNESEFGWRIQSVTDIDLKRVEEADYSRYCVAVQREGSQDFDGKITGIDECAFANLHNLKEVFLPQSITNIAAYAFFNCDALKSINLENISLMYDNAFYNCKSLKRVSLYKAGGFNGLMGLGERNFYGCTGLEEVDFGKDCALKTIPRECFYECASIKELKFHDRLRGIGNTAFCGCKSLKKVVFGAKSQIYSIGSYAFSDCTSLEEFILPSKINPDIWKPEPWEIDYIPAPVQFRHTDGMPVAEESENTREKVDFVIDEWAFESCISLKTFAFPEGVVKVAYATFQNCTSLNAVYVPKSVTFIDGFVFDGCPNMKYIYYAGTVKEWKALEKDEHWGTTLNREDGARFRIFVIKCSDGDFEEKYEF